MKDQCYAALFDKKDLPALYKMAERARNGKNELVDDFLTKCQRKVDDHNPGDEFLEVSKADDLVVTAGLNFMIDQILGVTTTRWQYMGKGTGITAPAVAQTTLVTESAPRVDMSLFGWQLSSSTSLRFAGIYGETIADITLNEAGVFTALTAGTMLNRNMFSSNPITHRVNETGFVIAAVIDFVPVVSSYG